MASSATPSSLPFSRRLGAALTALLVGSVAGALLLGLLFGLSVNFGWTPGYAIASEVAAGLLALLAGVWMLRLGLAAERAALAHERHDEPVR